MEAALLYNFIQKKLLFSVAIFMSVTAVFSQDFVETYTSAANGQSSAMYDLGVMYEDGLVVSQNYNEALEWYKKAARKGNTKAMIKIGNFYKEGYAVRKNGSAAMHWYLRALNRGNAIAGYYIGNLYKDGLGVEKDYEQAINWYVNLAINNHSESMFAIATMLEAGGYCIEINIEEALY